MDLDFTLSHADAHKKMSVLSCHQCICFECFVHYWWAASTLATPRLLGLLTGGPTIRNELQGHRLLLELEKKKRTQNGPLLKSVPQASALIMIVPNKSTRRFFVKHFYLRSKGINNFWCWNSPRSCWRRRAQRRRIMSGDVAAALTPALSLFWPLHRSTTAVWTDRTLFYL